MIWRTSTLPWVLLTWSQYTAAQQTWPSVTDELEDILFLTSGYRSRHFADGVTPCSASPGGVAGRNAAAEWIRTAFHDMAPGNAFQGVGGLDASLMFEADRGENIGSAFTTTLTTYAPFLSSRLSMADIISAGVYSATRSCGGPVIPVRGGRVDATAPGASGVPLPNDGTAVFTSRFNRMGYNRSEMIAFVACGHSLGGVHSSDFPDIVPAGTAPNDYATLDSTVAVFDNKIVTEYFAGTSKNPLIVGPSVKLKKNADTMVYTADGNATMKTLTNAATFSARCRDMFQKMIETVPAGVTLTDPVKPYEVKPYDVQLTLLDGGSQLAFTGEIRIRTTNRGTGSIGKVQLVYKNRTGATATTPIDTTYKGDASGFDDTFSFYSFSTKLPSDSSISSFNVLITNTPGASETQSNGGNGFKVDDTVIYQAPQSCQASGNLTVVAAVRSGTSSPTLRVVVKNPVAGVVVPSLSTTNIPMVTQSTVGAYQLYSASYSGSQAASFGVYSGSSSDNYKNASSLPSACSSLTAPSSTPIPTPTPSSAPFTFQGCYLDNGNPRALDWVGQADDGMTVEKCATFCSSFQLFGLEYGRECYCSNKLASYSTLMGLSDCNMACAGNSTQMCGSGSRLSLYKNNKYSPPVTPSISGYNYLGCYSEATNGRALTDTATTSDKMTVETCATFCGGSSYFGIEYSSECYCGSALQAGSTIQSSDDCNMVCGGNSTEFCGAGNRLNIY
ncbi:heme peroxidase, partial [Amniculicola lignicola CBS 123094]